MNNVTNTELSLRSLMLSIGISLVLALLAFVLFVLPAEYGEDPTGFGKLTGIANMGGHSVQALSTVSHPPYQDEAQFELQPFESVEYKYALGQGEAMVYSWQADGELVFDMHSEEQGRDPEDSITFSAGRASAEHGSYVAPFAGIHGWFWENRGDQPVIVRLQASGFFEQANTYTPQGKFVKDIAPH